MRNGFTLVELSIVLVIIGLLIGGILAAQSMIETTKVGAFVRQIGQFDAAVSNFQTKYNQLPGDNNLFGTGVVENSYIQWDGGGASDGLKNRYYADEIGRFWYDLSLSGLKNEDGAAYSANTSISDPVVIGVNAPKAKGADNATIIAYGIQAAAANYPSGNYYILTTITRTDAELSSLGNAAKPVFALAVDTKLDDANPYAGSVIGAYGGSGLHNASLGAANRCRGASNTVYDITDSSLDCQIIVRMGSTTGTPY
jgi:prepilin-type N-terminal cleavage/methylation domain-containing protein